MYSEKSHERSENGKNPFTVKPLKNAMNSSDSGCMPKGRRKADKSGDPVMPWKRNGER